MVPHPPLLVPEIAAGVVAETAPLRDACLVAARALVQRCWHWVPVAVVDLAAASRTQGSFAGYGADVQVALGPEAELGDGAELPLPLLLYSAAPYGVAYHIALWDAVPLEHS